MVPIGGKPLLAYWLETLVALGVQDILINTHYLAEQVTAFVNASEFRERVSLVYEEELLHTGGTLLKNKAFFDKAPFFVIHADNFSCCNYKDFIDAHTKRPKKTIATMMTFDTQNPQECGVIKKNNQGVMIEFFEKVKHPPSHIANGAVYLFEHEIFALLAAEKKPVIDLSNDIIPKLLGKINTFHNTQCHIDIGTIANYQLACDYARRM